METCQKALRTTLSVMLPRNPPPKNFRGLLDAFKSSKHVHHLVKLQHVAGAQFSLGWVWKWKSQIDFKTISEGFPSHWSGDVCLLKHLEATYEPAKRMIDRLLETDASNFEEHHYLDPIVFLPVRGQNLVWLYMICLCLFCMQESLAGLMPLRLTQPVDYSVFTIVQIYILHPNFGWAGLYICGVKPPSVSKKSLKNLFVFICRI
jgi:hypothetical protein